MRKLNAVEIQAVSGGREAVCTGFLWYLMTSQICCNAGTGAVCSQY